MYRWIRADHNAIRAFPAVALYPIDSTKKRISATITRIEGVRAFDIVMVIGFKTCHEERLCRLPTIDGAFSSHFEPSNLPERELALSNQGHQARQGHGHGVFVITHKGHVCLSAAQRVSARTRVKCFDL